MKKATDADSEWDKFLNHDFDCDSHCLTSHWKEILLITNVSIPMRDIIISTSDILLQNFDFYYIDKERSKGKYT